MDWDIVEGFAADDSVANKAKCWLLLAVTIFFSCLAGAIFILAERFAKNGNLYAGIAIVVQNILIIIAYVLSVFLRLIDLSVLEFSVLEGILTRERFDVVRSFEMKRLNSA